MKSEALKEEVRKISKMTHYEILEAIKYYKPKSERLGKQEKQFLQALEKEEKKRSAKLLENLNNLKADLFKIL